MIVWMRSRTSSLYLTENSTFDWFPCPTPVHTECLAPGPLCWTQTANIRPWLRCRDVTKLCLPNLPRRYLRSDSSCWQYSCRLWDPWKNKQNILNCHAEINKWSTLDTAHDCHAAQKCTFEQNLCYIENFLVITGSTNIRLNVFPSFQLCKHSKWRCIQLLM